MFAILPDDMIPVALDMVEAGVFTDILFHNTSALQQVYRMSGGEITELPSKSDWMKLKFLHVGESKPGYGPDKKKRGPRVNIDKIPQIPVWKPLCTSTS